MREEILVLTNEETKLCTRCGKFLNILRFSNNRSSGDGLQSWCKDCHREYGKTRSSERAINKAGFADIKLKDILKESSRLTSKQRTDLRNALKQIANKIK